MLSLSEVEKQILWDLYRGYEIKEIGERRGTTLHGVNKKLSRCMAREGHRSTLRLMVAFVDEYLGVGDPYPRIADPVEQAKGATA